LAPFASLRPKELTQLETREIGGYDRFVDAEAKILEQVLVQTDASSQGTIRLVVDKTACESCAGSAIPHFQRLRPGIKIEIIYPPEGLRF
jgi:DNA-binding transcriptional LysR family regulator